jgi:phage-related protein
VGISSFEGVSVELKFFTTADGKKPPLDVIKSLEKPDRAKIFGCLESIELLGFDTPRVDFRHIEGKLWEIKIRTASGGYRIFYVAIQSRTLVLLHAYKKQSQKAPDKEIKIAIKRLKEVLDHETDYFERSDHGRDER